MQQISDLVQRFNSRTREGCDGLQIDKTKRPRRFNSRTREGCDRGMPNRHGWQTKFQFTHPGGVRLKVIVLGEQELKFQFTHPGGVRQTEHTDSIILGGFNSRTREGCDSSFRSMSRLANVFQFTHPGGVRHQERPHISRYILVSIHAPGRGATFSRALCQPCPRFQFTHPGGVRPSTRAIFDVLTTVSIHAPGRGATDILRVIL